MRARDIYKDVSVGFGEVHIGLGDEGEDFGGEIFGEFALGGLLEVLHDGVHGKVDEPFGVGLGVENAALGIVGGEEIYEVIDVVVLHAGRVAKARADECYLLGVELGVEEKLVFKVRQDSKM